MKRNVLFAIAALAAAISSAEPYTRLFKVANPSGECRIWKAGATAAEPAQRNKAYPFGSTVVCGKDGSATLLFSETDAVRLLENTAAKVTLADTPAESRIVNLERGTALTRIGVNTAEDFVIVDTPAGRIRAISGNCRISVAATPAAKSSPGSVDVELRAEPASKMKVVGGQFIIPVLKNGNGALIESRTDDSYTCVTDLLGDYIVYVNTGFEADPPEPYEENPALNRIKFSTKAGLRLWREKAAVGGATVVAVLATSPTGKGRESFAFAVGKSSIAARSDIPADTTNEVAKADASAAISETQGDDFGTFGGGNDDGFGSFGDGDNADGGDQSADSAAAPASSGDSLFDFL